ncbi:polyketide synthase [Lentinula raphanica]|nr:polyketide synthase [Lentinula raphanica]
MEGPTSEREALHSPVAIVGFATEFPSGTHSEKNLSHQDFFDFLLEKRDAYERIPSDRFNIGSWMGDGQGQIATEMGAFLKHLSQFDHLEFGITAKDAKAMAVATRKLVELSFLALLDSGIDYRGRNVGCFVSGITADILSVADADEFDATGSFAGGNFMVANKVSYHLDLQGPSIPTDSACSSTLTALHLAVQSLRVGDCESAVVGGCQVNHRFIDWIQYSQGAVLAPDGKCKPFDESANGFSRAEGAACIVVKLLEDAIRDGDHIYGTVLGTGINSNGSAAPVSAPVAAGQVGAMERAFHGLHLQPSEVDYVETHTTGTAAGDPVEANWVGEKFGRKQELIIGSVKGNTGHLEIVAFLASLSKVCSMFQHGVIPPNVNLTTLNPAIKWKEYNLRVATEIIPLPRHNSDVLPVVSICSSGIGGTNGHAVIEAPPPQIPYVAEISNSPLLLIAGGLSPRSTSVLAEDLIKFAKAHSEDISALSTVCARRGRSMTWRSFSICSPDGSTHMPFIQPMLVPRKKTLVFILSGQGPQHFQMGRQLFKAYPVFRQTILHLDHVHESIVGHSLITKTGLFDNVVAIEPHITAIWPISTILPALAMVQIALIDLLRSVGITPDVVVGHSAGETVTLYSSGACSKEMAMELGIARGNAMLSTTKGAMAALSCTPTEAQNIILKVAGRDFAGKVEIACYNDDYSVTLSGLDEYVDQAIILAEEKGILARKLRTSVPVHSLLMESCFTSYNKNVEAVFARYPGSHTPSIPTFSTLTGKQWEASFNADYVWQGARHPVQFVKAISAIAERFPSAHFIEISPHPVLSTYTSTMCPSSSVVCPMKRTKTVKPHDEVVAFLKVVGHVVMLGHRSIDLGQLNRNVFASIQLPLPEYPFSRKHIPFYPESSVIVARQLASGPGHGRLLAKPGVRLGVHTHREIAEHIIRGEPIMPAAGFLEMAFELGARALRDVHFRSMMPLPSERPLHVEVETNGCEWKVYSRRPERYDLLHKQTNRLHADGLMSCECLDEEIVPLDLRSVRARSRPFPVSKLYDALSYFAQYGPTFRRVIACFKGQDEALVEVRAADSDLNYISGYIFHPAILDACFHAMIHPAFTGQVDQNVYYLPSKIQQVILHEAHKTLPSLPSVFAHIVFRKWRPDGIVFDLSITDPNGRMMCTMNGFELARHFISPIQLELPARYDITFTRTKKRITRPQITEISTIAASAMIFKFRLGREMNFKEQLQRHENSNNLSKIWVLADLALDAAGARGFSRSLRKELPHIDVHLVTFNTAWSDEEYRIIINQLSAMEAVEQEIHIDETCSILVPQLEPLPAPSPDIFDPALFWVNGRGGVSHPPLPTPTIHEVLVHISSCSALESGFFGFVGTVIDPGTTPWVGEVLGISRGPLANVVCVHEGTLTSLDSIHSATKNFASLAIPMLIATSALGSGALARPQRLHGRRILVTNNDTPTARALLWLFSVLGIQASAIGSNTTLPNLSLISKSDIIISGFEEDAERMTRNATLPACRLYFWKSNADGLQQYMCRDPWSVGDSLTQLLGALSRYGVSDIPVHSLDPVQWLPEQVTITSKALFESRKVYVLMGGIGSFGLQCCLWMYENGARNIILTSRTGKLKDGNMMALRVLSYLETLPDLQLQLISSDASSVSDARALFANITRTEAEVGGVMLLATVFADRPFTGHTEETYFPVFSSKVGAFEALRAAYPIEELDFLISMSSFATFGNAGQTNYASANTALDELLRPYRNAFSILSPALLDTSIITKADDWHSRKSVSHLTSWAMSSQQLCQCIGDGIRILRNQKFGCYIPELDWHAVQRDFGRSPLYNHILPAPEEQTTDNGTDVEDEGEKLRALVLQFLDVEPQEFSPEVPFTAYGLDSLSAGRLAFALRPYITISQVQLLADINFVEVLERINSLKNG